MAPFEIGKMVEVSPTPSELKGSYFNARIVQYVGAKYACLYLDAKDDSGNPMIHVVAKSCLRPVPPIVITQVLVGDVVDVPLARGWWLATVLDKNETHVTAQLKYNQSILEFEIGEVRIHQSWNRKTPSYWRYRKMD